MKSLSDGGVESDGSRKFRMMITSMKTTNIEWVPDDKWGTRWMRRVRNGRILGGIVFYTLRGSDRASFWRAYRAPTFEKDDSRSCFTLQEAIDWVEVEP